MGKFKKILFILTNKEKKHSLFLLVMVLIMAFLEMVGVASIMPFMSVLTNPDVVETNNLLNSFYLLPFHIDPSSIINLQEG